MKKYDVVIFGSGVAGLWLLNTLSDRGFSVLLIEKDAIGGEQTLGSQGMIHGGQKYLLGGNPGVQAARIASMPARWDACLAGEGDIDMRDVRVLAKNQVMWPAGGLLARIGLRAAANRIRARMRKIDRATHPEVFTSDPTFNGPVYELPEKVLDMNSLVMVLAARYGDRIRKGEVTALDREGRMEVSGVPIEAQLVISVAGFGNEDIVRLLGEDVERLQRRPLRQVMVKALPHPLYGHGVILAPSPRVTVTSYELPSGGYAWYLGGALSTTSSSRSDAEAIAFAKQEMAALFKNIDWSTKEWATWYGVRAEARDPHGLLPEGPVIQEYGKVWVAWPTKFTFTPLLSDQILTLVQEKELRPIHTDELPELPKPLFKPMPWERASWSTFGDA